MKKLLLLLSVVLAVAAPAAAQPVIDIEAALSERLLGDAAAPVTIIEYASLTCPHCAGFHAGAYQALKTRYIDTDKVKLIYRDFPLDGVALRAAMMARCADPRRYFGLLEVLFKSQSGWARAADPVAEIGKIGRLAGVDAATFKACMENEALVDGLVRIRQQGTADGVVSTPTFVIDGKPYPGNRSIEEFAEIIDPLLAGK